MPIDKRFREKEWNNLFSYENGVLPEVTPNQMPPASNISNVGPGLFHRHSVILQKCHHGSFLASVLAVQQDPGGATLCTPTEKHLHEADRPHGGSFLNEGTHVNNSTP